MLSQLQARRELEKCLGRTLHRQYDNCTGDANTCPIEECMLCSVRDCPAGEPLHYHHDGCPACSSFYIHLNERE